MATIYPKPNVTPAWGESNTTSADMIQPAQSEIQAGWPLSTIPPSRQRWNWILNFCANGLRYFMQRGLVDYDAAETYGVGARVIGDDNQTYSSLVANNLGHTPSLSPSQWSLWALTLSQLNSLQITQATQGTGDSSNKVATTAFVTNAVSPVAANVATLIGEVNTLMQPDTLTDVTGGRSFGAAYTNSTGKTIVVSGNASISGGSGDSTITCLVGAVSASTVVYSNTETSTQAGKPVGFFCVVPNGFHYSVNVTGIITGAPASWIETSI